MRKKKFLGHKIESSFFSCEEDTELILKMLFEQSVPYNEELVRLLTINKPDCISNRDNTTYKEIVDENNSFVTLRDKGYIRLKPKWSFEEHDGEIGVKNYITIGFDNFVPNAANPYYRDCNVIIDIMCHLDNWDLTNFQSRPIKIMGYIDGLLNGARLTGLGTLNFIGAAAQIPGGEDLAGYTLIYRAVHGDDDMEDLVAMENDIWREGNSYDEDDGE